MIRRISKSSFNNKGSALVMALVIMTILIILGLAVATLSLGTLLSNTEDAENNEAYYAAEAGVNSAIEQIKYEASRYYSAMLVSSGNDYSLLLNNFFNNIKVNSEAYFVEPDISGITTQTTFTTGAFDPVESICEFIVSCNATSPDGAGYVIDGKIYIKKIDVNASGGELILVDNAALIAGNLLNIRKNCGFVINGGDALVKEVIYDCSWVPYLINGGNLYITPSIGDSVTEILNYTSYTDPDMTNPDTVVTSHTTFNWNNIPPSPISIISTPGADIHVNSCIITSGVIHSGGDIHMNNGIFTVDLYSDGDIHINNCTINGNIYCRGNFYGNNAVINGSVISEGAVDWHNGALNGSVYGEYGVHIKDASGIGDVISPGLVEINRTAINGGLVYSSTKVLVGDCSIKAVIYSLGDVEINKSMSIQGAIIAKNDVFYNKNNVYFTINYSQQIIENILEDTDYSFFSPVGGAQNTLDSGVFVSQEIAPIGRTN